ncbi:hypothetical protein GZH53_12505 [Flavihumibacter sp. R14]|nr:hypothetical protein [Flavihumibacter soli]
MEQGWVKIYTSNDFFKSEMVRQALNDHELDPILINKQGFPYRVGEVEVYIHADNFHQAIEIIVKNEL